MGALVQDLIVASIVLVAAVYAVAKVLPAAWRTAFVHGVAETARFFGLPAAHARRIEAKLASGGACGSCDSCKACASPAPTDPAQRRTIPIRPLNR